MGRRMKKKYFLRGLGTGIVFTAVILMIATAGKNKNTMTDKEVIKKAYELGMVEKEQVEATVVPTTGASIKVTKKPKQASTQIPVTKAPQQTPKAEATTKPTIEPTKEPKETQTPKNPDKKNKDKKSITVSITAGMWSEQLAAYLHKLELVKNAEEFDDFLCNNGYASNIKVGIYEIPKNATYAEIANIITK